jgi:TonB family protein
MRQAAAASQMRAQAPAMQPIPPMPMPMPAAAPALRAPVNDWTPETVEDDFAQVAAQARLGVQRKVVDEVARRKKQRLLTACGVAVAVAGVIVFLIEKFYDPEARARERAIAAEVTRMAEQQKVTDNLTLIEVDIENAIMNNDLDAARAELAALVAKSPGHPRREFLQKSIDRAAELQRLAGQAPAPAQVISPPTVADRKAPPRRPAERNANREDTRTPTRSSERSVAGGADRSGASRTSTNTLGASSPPSRTYGAPISEPPRQATIRLDAPINSPPTTAPAQRSDNFPGRTIEASDSAGGRATSFPSSGSSNPSGSAAVSIPPPAAPAQTPPPAVDVVPAKIVKRVTPVVGQDVPSKTAGFVIVRFEIGTNGRVSNLAVVESTPPGVFDEAATTAVRKWIYEPRRENGVAVASQSKAKLVFDAAN